MCDYFFCSRLGRSFLAETRRETIHGGSMPASMRATVSAKKEHSRSLELASSEW
ncbi:MAG: hypothetical protein GXP22_07220 [Gammaproteobacteria bacterium]|nr:hypothetical protein [Gammaproteobacteria bacterium]